jgi:hypothetical protein
VVGWKKTKPTKLWLRRFSFGWSLLLCLCGRFPFGSCRAAAAITTFTSSIFFKLAHALRLAVMDDGAKEMVNVET